jgi:hypothetical protein
VDVPREEPDPDATVVALDLAGEPLVFAAPRIEAPGDSFVQPIEVRVEAAAPGIEARYTLDGTEPQAGSPRAAGPIRLVSSATLSARSFYRGRPVGPVVRRTFTLATPRPAVAASVVPGLAWSEYPGTWERLPDLLRMEPVRRGTAEQVRLSPDQAGTERIALLFEGFLRVPADDVYALELESDDGSRLWIDGELAVDHDGLHGRSAQRGEVALAAGLHRLVVAWFNRTGQAALELRCAPLGSAPREVAASQLFRAGP